MKKLLLITTLCCAFSVNAQFRLVKDINVGINNSSPSDFYNYSGRLYFTAGGTYPNRYLFSTDGTELGTTWIQTSNYNQSLQNISGVNWYEYNSELYFDATIIGSSSQYYPYYVCKLNNSNVSTILNIETISGDYRSKFTQAISYNDKLIFNSLTALSPSPGVEPYFINLLNTSNNGVLLDINPGAYYNHSDPKYFTALSSGVIFSAYDQTNGRELWKTDGTTGGTVLFQDINSGAGDSNPDNFNVLGSQLTFAATHTTLGRELFKTNGNTGNLVLIKDINTSGNSNPTNVKNVNGTLYFSADNGSVGQELWKSNGLNSGTTLVKDINPSGNSNPSKFFQFGTDIYFIADDGVNGVELWKTDGSPVGTDMVKDINSTGSSSPNYFTEYNGRLYFTASDGVNGTELWVTDGTAAGTVMIELNPNGDAFLSNLIVFNNELYLSGNDSVSGIGQELWAFNDAALSANDFQLNGKSISLYPNPTKDAFQLQTEIEVITVEIYSLQGQLVKTLPSQLQYIISDLAKGMYLVKINSNEGSVNKTLIIE